MDTSEKLFIGVKSHVVAFSKHDGSQLWKTKLGGEFLVSGERFVTVLAEGDRVYAHTCGKLFCLDARTGEILWKNELAGLGYGIAMLAVIGASSPSLAALAEIKRRSASDSATAGAATA